MNSLTTYGLKVKKLIALSNDGPNWEVWRGCKGGGVHVKI